ncbi:MAG: alpha/beta hydrolase [Rhizobiales bacterium]|nr:alpha/beta hydrolase [Hyphomicrobiales bacterium]
MAERCESLPRQSQGATRLPLWRAPRNIVDVFEPGSAGPIVLFIHGGYWRSFDKSYFSHVASVPLQLGYTAAIPSYSLCPEVSVCDIIDELRQCCIWLHNTFKRPLVAAGHSAGGHLAACLAATDWRQYGQAGGLVSACLSISGLFDLRPLLAVPINDDLKLDRVTAAAASPLLWPLPFPKPLVSCVGALESGEFKRQAASLAAAWKGLGCDSTCFAIESANHFTALDALSDPQSRPAMELRRICDAS